MSQIDTPWSTIGYLTYKRTYARQLEGRTEEFPETVQRVIDACYTQLALEFTPEEKERLSEYFLKLKCSVAGRFLWQLGTHTVDRFGLASLQNCAFTVIDSPIRPFCWAMDMLALGSGVGYNIQKEHVDKLPEVREWFKAPTRVNDAGADFIIPDSREGWVKFLGKTLKAAFLSETPDKGTFTYSTQCIRGKGTPIKGFGGVASGPEDLVWGVNEISKILMKRHGRKIRPIDALDIMNIIGYIIVAGNVRRSAQIAIGDPDDVEYLLAKRWDMGNIPKWRAMSNNSVACNSIEELHEYFWDGYEGKGEPYGLINLSLSRTVGRLGETKYPDPEVMGYNPCAEQSLAPYETCCLAEVFLPNVESKEEFLDILEFLYKINKHSLMLPCHHPETEAIVRKNMRMGIGLTGILQATEIQRSWMDEGYEFLRELDAQYSEEMEWNKSIKLTTVKPSGTLSLLPGVTPGIHPGYAQYMYRRIRVASDHHLVDVCRTHGYPVEYVKNFDGTEDYNTVVITFPFSYPEGTVLAKDVTAFDQMEAIRKLQSEWSDNSVSCTIYYKKEEIPKIRQYLEKYYKYNFKSLSFLLHSEHGFMQAPYEEVTKEEYEKLVNSTKLIKTVELADFDTSDECATGACPIR
jgi:adenosylcobalamin-dependent ribonucleoside-triphosphate reductase